MCRTTANRAVYTAKSRVLSGQPVMHVTGVALAAIHTAHHIPSTQDNTYLVIVETHCQHRSIEQPEHHDALVHFCTRPNNMTPHSKQAPVHKTQVPSVTGNRSWGNSPWSTINHVLRMVSTALYCSCCPTQSKLLWIAVPTNKMQCCARTQSVLPSPTGWSNQPGAFSQTGALPYSTHASRH